MKYLGRYIEDALKLKPLGEISYLDEVDVVTGRSGVRVVIDGVMTDLFVTTADYVKWLEDVVKSHESPDSAPQPVYRWNVELHPSPAYFNITTTVDPDITSRSIKV